MNRADKAKFHVSQHKISSIQPFHRCHPPWRTFQLPGQTWHQREFIPILSLPSFLEISISAYFSFLKETSRLFNQENTTPLKLCYGGVSCLNVTRSVNSCWVWEIFNFAVLFSWYPIQGTIASCILEFNTGKPTLRECPAQILGIIKPAEIYLCFFSLRERERNQMKKN